MFTTIGILITVGLKGNALDELLTVANAAKELGMATGSLHTAIRQGRIPVVKLGPNTTLIRREDIEAYKATPKGSGGRPRKAAEPDTKEG
jgi:excisionase family DNA binding protein